ncbi:MAG: SpoIIE family protein phosphatase [Akkermansiaceae bacterium]|nr:SpoIIE family protein phosphatase [Armatimonadota bacterium]
MYYRATGIGSNKGGSSVNQRIPIDTNFPGEILRDINEKLVIASVQQHELAEIATKAEQRLAALVNGLDAVICEISVQTGEILFLSEQAESILGYERTLLKQRGFWRRTIHPDDRSVVLTYLYAAIRERRAHEHEFRILTGDGRVIWVHSRAAVIVGPDDTPDLVRCIVEDVSERKRSEESIAQSERRYRRLFEAARDGILLLDIHTGVITEANPFVTELLGVPHDALVGKEFFEVGLFADKERSRAVFDSIRRDHYVHYESLPLHSRTGTDRTVELVGNVYDESGGTVIQCNLRDVTERRRAEVLQAEALQREQRITEFLQRPLRTNFSEDAFPGLSLVALYEPALAEAEVGGDFFDAFVHSKPAGSQQIVLCVGDVMGKGLQAAALAGRLKEVLHAFIGENPDPAQTLFRLNNYLCDIMRGKNALDGADILTTLSLSALSLAVVDPETGTITVAAAGAEPVAILRAPGYAEAVTAAGLTLGIQRDEPFKNVQITLHSGDTLIMTTDGLTEARRDNAFLGYDGLLDIALKNASNPSISGMGQAIVQDARAFCGSFNDDVCLLLARCRD